MESFAEWKTTSQKVEWIYWTVAVAKTEERKLVNFSPYTLDLGVQKPIHYKTTFPLNP